MVVEEKLGADVIGPGIDFGFEVFQLGDSVRCAGVTFRESGDSDAKLIVVGFGEAADVVDEIGGKWEIAGELCVVVRTCCFWRITAKGEDVANSCKSVAFEDL